jgi:hypothetical protein
LTVVRIPVFVMPAVPAKSPTVCTAPRGTSGPLDELDELDEPLELELDEVLEPPDELLDEVLEPPDELDDPPPPLDELELVELPPPEGAAAVLKDQEYGFARFWKFTAVAESTVAV